ncbi:hypothetical protein [Microscilla marina]|uniref:Uncharacterized protein n=1 Tax=Microscilla marina ATCC 23134 TaxID=313606 RepID=A1ZX35_MICM2|nr:hypothetical protein [Microscilla marina]EAY25016.1 hypothetical protein M23134_07205 [Microscilla marina ATCC 23134]
MAKITIQDYIKAFHCESTRNFKRFRVEIYLKTLIEEDHETIPRPWYNLRGEKAIQWTLLLAKVFRDKLQVEVTFNEKTRRISEIRKVE